MKNKCTFFLKLFLVLSFFSYNAFSQIFGQEIIELLDGSDEIKMDGKNGNFIVTGNVVFKKGETKFYCDSAYFNNVNNNIRAYGNVHLNKQDTLNMFCDSVHYDVSKEYAKLYGNVRLRNEAYKLTTDSLDYDLKNDFGLYLNYGDITDITSNDSLSSKVGYFYPKTEQFHFQKEVRFKNPTYLIKTDTLQFNYKSKVANFFGPTDIFGDSITMYCESGWYDLQEEIGVFEKKASIVQSGLSISADSLYYSAFDSLYIARKSVKMTDTTNKLAFQGDYAFQDGKQKYSFLTGRALAKRFQDEDTLYIHADTLINYLDSTNKPDFIQAFYNVKIFKSDLQGICDSLTYEKNNGQMNLYHSPILWAKGAQLSGDTISVYEKNDEIERAFVRKQGLVVTRVDTTKYYNQVSGTNIWAFFNENELKRVSIDGNAKTLYFLEDETKSDSATVVFVKGMNSLAASEIILRFSGGDIETAKYQQQPAGVFYPMKNIDPKEEQVEHFKWDTEKRPLSWQQMIYSEEEQKMILRIYKAVMRPFLSGMLL